MMSDLSFKDAIIIAQGCLDYGGGYRNDNEKLEVFHHGIETVIRALVAAGENQNDSQVMVLRRIGKMMFCYEPDKNNESQS